MTQDESDLGFVVWDFEIWKRTKILVLTKYKKITNIAWFVLGELLTHSYESLEEVLKAHLMPRN